MWYCDLCQIHCTSDYGKNQHLKGRKHLTNSQLRRGSKRPHETLCGPADATTEGSRENAPRTDFAAEFTMYKAAATKGNSSTPNVFPVFTNAHQQKQSRFDPIYKDAFRRKRDVNLCIRNGLVVWEFAYNELVIGAIKQHIKGRKWNPSLGRKGCWTNPLEVLPDAISLYEFMGRKADDSLKKRAKEITKACGGGSAADAIKLSVSLNTENASEQTDLGRVHLSFHYDATIVSTIKMLSPGVRTFEPTSKAWSVDLLALPELLDHLKPVGYTPPDALQGVADACIVIINPAVQPNLDGTSEAENGPLTTSPTENKADASALMKEQLSKIVASLKKVQTPKDDMIDRSDCGSLKRQRWSYGCHDLSSLLAAMANHHTRNLAATMIPDDCDCGNPHKTQGGVHVCRYFGKFQCWSCNNTWTSGYCWKGEKQACRQCNMDNEPIEKRPLEKKPVLELTGGSGGPHDSARCTMCRKLGYDCSI